LATFNPDINWPEGRVEGSRFRVETLIKGKLTQKEFLQHVQTVAIAQLEEGDELIMTVEVLEPEPMKIRKTTLAQQMAEKAYDSTKVIRKNLSPRLSGDTGRYFRNKRPVSYHPIDLGITRSN